MAIISRWEIQCLLIRSYILDHAMPAAYGGVWVYCTVQYVTVSCLCLCSACGLSVALSLYSTRSASTMFKPTYLWSNNWMGNTWLCQQPLGIASSDMDRAVKWSPGNITVQYSQVPLSFERMENACPPWILKWMLHSRCLGNYLWRAHSLGF